jgi:hypothetical protein
MPAILATEARDDPNWFYSTAAQATAAIVGLAGGFLAARLVSHRSEIADQRQPLRATFLGLMSTASTYRNYVNDYVGNLRVLLKQLEEQRARGVLGQEPLSLANIAGTLGGIFRGPQSSPGTQVISEGEAEKLNELGKVAVAFQESLNATEPKPFAEALKVGRLPIPERFATEGAVPAAPTDWWAELELQEAYAGSVWYQLSLTFDPLAKDLAAFRSRLVPWTMGAMLGLLGALLICGAVIPMAYLTAHGGSSKTLLLLAFATLSLSVVVVLAIEMTRIRAAAQLDRETF